MPRASAPELMDDPAIGVAELEESFRFIRGVNRWLGGARALVEALESLHAAGEWPRDRPLHLLDVGTGIADLPEAAWRWAKRRGLEIAIVGIDPSSATIELARARLQREAPDAPIALRVAGVEALDPNDGYDLAHAAMLLHHFDDPGVERALAAMGAAARTVLWNDLWRQPLSQAAVRVMTLASAPVVRHDAILSVDKGFTPAEMHERARAAGLRVQRLRRMPMSGRLVATMRREA
ncbi:MAG: methyltransferase domain-containing protein [Phycisphaerales bacterium]